MVGNEQTGQTVKCEQGCDLSQMRVHRQGNCATTPGTRGTPRVLSLNVSRDTHPAYKCSRDKNRCHTHRDTRGTPRVRDAQQTYQLSTDMRRYVWASSVCTLLTGSNKKMCKFISRVKHMKQRFMLAPLLDCGHPYQSRLTFTLSDSTSRFEQNLMAVATLKNCERFQKHDAQFTSVAAHVCERDTETETKSKLPRDCTTKLFRDLRNTHTHTTELERTSVCRFGVGVSHVLRTWYFADSNTLGCSLCLQPQKIASPDDGVVADLSCMPLQWLQYCRNANGCSRVVHKPRTETGCTSPHSWLRW